MNHENAICYCINRVEPNYGLFIFCEQPLAPPGIPINLSSGLSGLLQRVVRRTRPTVSLVLMTDHLFGLGRPFGGSAARAATYSSARKERFVFPLIVMTPRGPGILSLR